eukprot:4102644-Lingulodinium_polyedra.AAC.1
MQWHAFARKHSCVTVSFDQCMLGGSTQKPTTVGSNIEGIDGPELFGGLRCTHAEGHDALIGVDAATGLFRTAGTEAYPSA